jgi:chromosome partitioning protein
MIDLDPSSNLSLLMGYESDLEESEAASYNLSKKAIVKYTFDHLISPFLEFRKNRDHVWADSKEIIKKPYGEFGPHFIPSDLFLADLADKLAAYPGDRDHALKTFFKMSAEGKIPGFDISCYDYVFIDCAASLNIMTLNAMATADYVICPVKMDLFGAKGISRLNTEINELRSRSDDFDIELVILPTHYSNNISRTARMQEQLQAYRNNLTTCSISQSELFPSTQDSYMPLTLQMPTSVPVEDYRKFVDILLKNIAKKFS